MGPLKEFTRKPYAFPERVRSRESFKSLCRPRHAPSDGGAFKRLILWAAVFARFFHRVSRPFVCFPGPFSPAVIVQTAG